jgi:hypothetical protein
MKSRSFMAAAAITLLMAGCAASNEKAPDIQTAEATAPAADKATASDVTDRQFIRTSDMKFRVKDVARATYHIEELTRSCNGFVTYTHLESITDEKSTKAISADSALETIRYTVVNNMTIRVPNTMLDSTLQAIAALVDHLDYRTIKADDVALQIKANQMTQTRAANNSQRVRHAIDNRGRKLGETADAEGQVTDRSREADEAAIANLSLRDQVNYSTVSLSLYQRAETRRWIIPNPDNTDDYRPGFWLRIADALKGGWHLVQDLVVLLTNLWVLLLLAALGFFVYRRYWPGKAMAKSKA